MKTPTRLISLCVALVVGAAVINTTSAQTQPEFKIVPIPFSALHHAQKGAPHIRNRNGTSLNWSGYAVETSLAAPQPGSVSYVSGNWTIPTVTASTSANTYSSIWVGIDGYSDKTVEQIGTEQDWTSSGQQNYVWFEMYPRGAYQIVGFPIKPGDNFGASVQYNGGGTFVLTIINYTAGVYYKVPIRYTKMTAAQRKSAEWIVEAPYSGGILPLADFGTATFSSCQATLNGQTGSISNSLWQNDAITMQTSTGVTKAQPSVLSLDGTSFTVTWFHE